MGIPSQHHTRNSTALILMGDSGTGKTAALMSLIRAGKNVRILDTDNGTTYLVNKLLAECPEREEQLIIETVSEKPGVERDGEGNLLLPEGETPLVYNRIRELTTHWNTATEDLGLLAEWGSDDVLVIDSLSTLSRAVMDHVLWEGVITRNKKPTWNEYEIFLRYIRALFVKLTALATKNPSAPDHDPLNLLVMAHIQYEDGAPMGKTDSPKAPLVSGETNVKGKFVGYPNMPGKFRREIPIYFNTIVQMMLEGEGSYTKRYIRTQGDSILRLKAAAPDVPAELDAETGLAELFDRLQGKWKEHA